MSNGFGGWRAVGRRAVSGAVVLGSLTASYSGVSSLVTSANKSDEDLKGLVYSLTPRQQDDWMPWHRRPATLAVIVLGITLVLNIVFW